MAIFDSLNTFFFPVVDRAMFPALESPDMGLNIRICAVINTEELSGTEVVKAMKRNISPENDDLHGQRLALKLLEAWVMNYEKVKVIEYL